MRLGERSLDDSVEKVLSAIEHFERQGVLDRPALSLAADLIDQFRAVLQNRHRQAQRALTEILGEVLKTEWDLIQALSGANQAIKQTGQDSCAQMQDCLGDLTGEIDRAQNLEELKNYAISAVGSLRQEINGLLSRQSEIVDKKRVHLGAHAKRGGQSLPAHAGGRGEGVCYWPGRTLPTSSPEFGTGPPWNACWTGWSITSPNRRPACSWWPLIISTSS